MRFISIFLLGLFFLGQTTVPTSSVAARVAISSEALSARGVFFRRAVITKGLSFVALLGQGRFLLFKPEGILAQSDSTSVGKENKSKKLDEKRSLLSWEKHLLDDPSTLALNPVGDSAWELAWSRFLPAWKNADGVNNQRLRTRDKTKAIQDLNDELLIKRGWMLVLDPDVPIGEKERFRVARLLKADPSVFEASSPHRTISSRLYAGFLLDSLGKDDLSFGAVMARFGTPERLDVFANEAVLRNAFEKYQNIAARSQHDTASNTLIYQALLRDGMLSDSGLNPLFRRVYFEDLVRHESGAHALSIAEDGGYANPSLGEAYCWVHHLQGRIMHVQSVNLQLMTEMEIQRIQKNAGPFRIQNFIGLNVMATLARMMNREDLSVSLLQLNTGAVNDIRESLWKLPQKTRADVITRSIAVISAKLNAPPTWKFSPARGVRRAA